MGTSDGTRTWPALVIASTLLACGGEGSPTLDGGPPDDADTPPDSSSHADAAGDGASPRPDGSVPGAAFDYEWTVEEQVYLPGGHVQVLDGAGDLVAGRLGARRLALFRMESSDEPRLVSTILLTEALHAHEVSAVLRPPHLVAAVTVPGPDDSDPLALEVRTYDVSDPSRPSEVARLALPSDECRVRWDGPLLFASRCPSSGVAVYDGSDPTDITRLGEMSRARFLPGIAASDTHVFAPRRNEMEVYARSDLATPLATVTLDSSTAARAEAATLLGDELWVRTSERLLAFDVSDPTSPAPLFDETVNGSRIDAMRWHGDHLWLLNDAATAYAVDRVAETATRLDRATNSHGTRPGFAFMGERLLLDTRLFDISDPTDVVEVGYFPDWHLAAQRGRRGSALPMDASARALCVLDVFRDELWVYDLREGAPGPVSRVPLEGFPKALRASEHQCHVLGQSAYTIVDVSDPASPVAHSPSPHGSTQGWAFDLYGDRAFVAAGPSGLRVLDVTDPAAIVEVGVIDPEPFDLLPRWTAVTVGDGVLFVTSQRLVTDPDEEMRPAGMAGFRWSHDPDSPAELVSVRDEGAMVTRFRDGFLEAGAQLFEAHDPAHVVYREDLGRFDCMTDDGRVMRAHIADDGGDALEEHPVRGLGDWTVAVEARGLPLRERALRCVNRVAFVTGDDGLHVIPTRP